MGGSFHNNRTGLSHVLCPISAEVPLTPASPCVEYRLGSSSYFTAIVRYNDRVRAVCELLTVSSVQFSVGYSLKSNMTLFMRHTVSMYLLAFQICSILVLVVKRAGKEPRYVIRFGPSPHL